MIDESQSTVVLVDDEPMVVTALQSFLQLETSYNILTFTSAVEALEVLDDESIHVLVADYMMPDMDGITFFIKARELRPAATRILLTGYADKQNAIRAINEAGLYYYLEKPWDNDQLGMVIRNGVERSRLFHELDQRVGALNLANEELDALRGRLIKAFM
jgi:response regulator RpfG family c-di-GMP phosphodiesterase